MDQSLTRCPCWPVSTAKQSGLVTSTFDLLTLKVVSESRVTCATSVPIVVFLGLSVLDLGPMYATDRHQTTSSLNARWAGHNNRNRVTSRQNKVIGVWTITVGFRWILINIVSSVLTEELTHTFSRVMSMKDWLAVWVYTVIIVSLILVRPILLPTGENDVISTQTSYNAVQQP